MNVARFVFLNPRARSFFIDWPTAANDMVAALRAEAGQNPYDRELSDLVGELSTRSEEFATRWAAQNVRFHRSGIKEINHPIVGDLHLTFEAMDLPADPGLSLIVYSAEARSGSDDALKLLASWTADEEEPAAAGETSSPLVSATRPTTTSRRKRSDVDLAYHRMLDRTGSCSGRGCHRRRSQCGRHRTRRR